MIESWRSLAEEPASQTGMQRIRLDTEAAADVFACILWPSRCPGLLIEGDGAYRPRGDHIPTCRGVRTIHEIVSSPNERTILRVVLEDDRLLDIFAVLSADLVGTVVGESSVATALGRCIDRLCLWQSLFERIPADGLSDEQQRGMLGELTILETFLLPRMDASLAITAWMGPEKAHQDFVHSATAIEVKTSLAKRHARIMIANEKQLDERPYKALVLAHLRLDESALGISLPTAVDRVRKVLIQHPAASILFDERLMLGGYLDVHAPIYLPNRWRISSARFYHVRGNFPRLTDMTLPPGVGDIRYSIIADDLGTFEISAAEAAALMELNNE